MYENFFVCGLCQRKFSTRKLVGLNFPPFGNVLLVDTKPEVIGMCPECAKEVQKTINSRIQIREQECVSPAKD